MTLVNRTAGYMVVYHNDSVEAYYINSDYVYDTKAEGDREAE